MKGKTDEIIDQPHHDHGPPFNEGRKAGIQVSFLRIASAYATVRQSRSSRWSHQQERGGDHVLVSVREIFPLTGKFAKCGKRRHTIMAHGIVWSPCG